MQISSLINRVARGKHGSDHLSRSEACFIFSSLMQPQADPLQLGAFLIAERMKGENAAELAGFVDAAREHTPHFSQLVAPQGAVDLPCYAGKRRAAHAHLVAALQARDAGIPVFVHGVEMISDRITAWQILAQHGVSRATTLSQAAHFMQQDGLVYMDLADISPNLHHIYQLRPRLGVRSFANTVARLLNPMQCQGQLNGFFHTPYADYMTQANALLQQPRSLVFMGTEGEPELYADRQKVVKMQLADVISDVHYPDKGQAIYPRQPLTEINDIFSQFENMINNKPDDREQETIKRMLHAFLWASGKAPLKTD